MKATSRILMSSPRRSFQRENQESRSIIFISNVSFVNNTYQKFVCTTEEFVEDFELLVRFQRMFQSTVLDVLLDSVIALAAIVEKAYEGTRGGTGRVLVRMLFVQMKTELKLSVEA